MYMVAKDAAGNYSKVEKVKVQTKDDTPPQLLRQDFEPTITDGSGMPRADSSIKLVFSENVKGGTGDSSVFLTLYEAVQKAVRQKDVDAEVKARNDLGNALYNHIALYNGQTGRDGGMAAANYKCKAVTDPTTQEKHVENAYTDEKNPWVINYCYATVQLSGGNLTVTFPTVKDDAGNILETSALRLASGATYYMDGTTETAFPTNANNDPARIDYHFSMEPETVKGMAEDWLSDILLAADTTMKFTLYKRVRNEKTGVMETWELVGSAELSVPSGSRWAYKSVAWWFPGPDIATEAPVDKFIPVKDLEPYTEYAIHVDELAGEDEFKKWSGPVTMMAYVMAGKTRELSRLRRRLRALGGQLLRHPAHRL